MFLSIGFWKSHVCCFLEKRGIIKIQRKYIMSICRKLLETLKAATVERQVEDAYNETLKVRH